MSFKGNPNLTIIGYIKEKNSGTNLVLRDDSVIELTTKSDIEILAIGIGHDVSRYYSKAIKITDVQELGDVMITQLSGLFENKKKLN